MHRALHLPSRHPLLSLTIAAALSTPICYHALKPTPFTTQPNKQTPPTTIHQPQKPTSTMPTSTTPTPTHPQLTHPYTATFSVPMHCTGCTTALTTALAPLPGIHSTSTSLPTQLLTVTGTTPPSTIIATIRARTNRTAILRGSGAPDSAAVCILETPITFAPTTRTTTVGQQGEQIESPIRGLIRLLDLSPQLTMLDVALSGLRPGVYRASVRATGDVSRGVESMGGEWGRGGGGREVEVGLDGRAGWVGEVEGWRVGELVGRGVVVERVAGEGEGEGDEVVVGVVARSAGAWENEKVVCGCSGKTVWEERAEMVGKGMV